MGRNSLDVVVDLALHIRKNLPGGSFSHEYEAL
jgi:hypothetical protein